MRVIAEIVADNKIRASYRRVPLYLVGNTLSVVEQSMAVGVLFQQIPMKEKCIFRN